MNFSVFIYYCCIVIVVVDARLLHQWLFRSAVDPLRDIVTGALVGSLSGGAVVRNSRLQVQNIIIIVINSINLLHRFVLMLLNLSLVLCHMVLINGKH
jgi:hypothetical protein